MKKLKGILLISLFTIAMIFLVQNYSYADSDFSYKSMDYDVKVNEDGSMDVVETWTVKINGTTNTLFKNFEKDKSKFSSISNVRVTEVSKSGKETDLDRIYNEMYHVTTDRYYAMSVSGNKFEIAWGVNEDSGTKTYKMYYTVNDCVKVYNDCADIYWKFVNNTSGNTVKAVTGKIELPSSVSDIENLKVWGHGNVNGSTERSSKDTIKFNAKNYNSDYLEVRVVVTEEDMFYGATRIYEDKLDEILEYEKELADKANFEKIVRMVIAIFVITVIYVINILIFLRAIKKKKILKETPKKVPTQVYDYFRDFPRKDDTPAQVAFLHYFNAGRAGGTNVGKVISATMLDLCLKKYLKFEVNNAEKVSQNEKIKIIIDKEKNEEGLLESESQVLKLLKLASKTTDSITMKEFEKYAKSNSTSFYAVASTIDSKALKEEAEVGNYSKEEAKKGTKYTMSITLSIMLMIGELILGINIISLLAPIFILALIPSAIFLIYNIVISARVVSRFNGLTQLGVDEQEKLRALKKYMEEFSLIKDREVPELVLWEKYLVYATTMGVADKVLQQLKVVYPQLTTDQDIMRNTSYLYMMSNNNFGNSFISSINSSVNKAYTASAPSSSSGGGGGFSGGGGGGGGGGCSGGR